MSVCQCFSTLVYIAFKNVLNATTEVWVLVYWPEEDSTTVAVTVDHLVDGEGCEVGSDCVIRNLPGHTGKVGALSMFVPVCVI